LKKRYPSTLEKKKSGGSAEERKTVFSLLGLEK